MAVLQVLSVALVCLAVQAAPPSWANGGPQAEGLRNHPLVAAMIEERIEQFKARNGSQTGPHQFGGPQAWRPQNWGHSNHSTHFGRPLAFHHDGRPQGPQGESADQKPQKPARFGPPVINYINSPEEAGALPVAPVKQQRWAKRTTKTAVAAVATTAPVTSSPAPVPAKAPVASAGSEGGPLNICSWNIFRFGQAKFAAEPMAAFKKAYGKDKLEMIGEQIKNADILALQEYFDTTETHDVVNVVIDYLNKISGSTWGVSVGPRVGRGSQEQYAFLYRKEMASVMKEAVAPEPAGKDPYSREPWFVQFKITKPGFSLPSLTMGTIHTDPDFAIPEMNALDEYTFPWAEQNFNTKDVMVLGDYNADCQYVRKSDWPSITLFTKPDYTWFIPTGVDTAAMNSECTFDRAVTRSPKVVASFVPGSLRVLDFVAQYKIKVAEARRLSDHFPVCMQFK